MCIRDRARQGIGSNRPSYYDGDGQTKAARDAGLEVGADLGTCYAVRHIPSTRYRAWPITCSTTGRRFINTNKRRGPCAADRIIVGGQRMAPPLSLIHISEP